MLKSKTRPFAVAIALFLVIFFTQPTISTGKQIVFDYIARFLICLAIGFGVEWVISRGKKR
ncbi:MAG: hypothetical protein WCK98_07590 [bacterium]